jgi:hypothetical protein
LHVLPKHFGGPRRCDHAQRDVTAARGGLALADDYRPALVPGHVLDHELTDLSATQASDPSEHDRCGESRAAGALLEQGSDEYPDLARH